MVHNTFLLLTTYFLEYNGYRYNYALKMVDTDDYILELSMIIEN